MTIYPDIDLNRWEVENNCNVVLANADYYYTKGQVDKKIDDIETSGVTEEKAQEMIDKSLQDYYSKGETDSFINKLEETDTTISGVVNVLDETVDGIAFSIFLIRIGLIVIARYNGANEGENGKEKQ